MSSNHKSVKLTLLLGAAGVGAVAMYLLDPSRGARRRAELFQRLFKFGRTSAQVADKVSRNLYNRSKGFVLEHTHRDERDASDDVLIARVRSRLGHVYAGVSSIQVLARNGVVTLVTSAPEGLHFLLRSVAKIRGVKQVNIEGSVPAHSVVH